MRRFLLCVVLALTVFAGKTIAGGPGNPPAYSIKIRVKGIKDTTCYLAYHFGDKQYLKDTAKVDSKGNFTFTGNEKLPGGIYMAVLPDKRYFEFIVSEQSFSLETDTADYVNHMKVSGTVENKLFYNYLQALYLMGKRIDSLRNLLATAKTKADTTAIREKMGKVEDEIKDYRAKIAKENPNTFVSRLFRAMETIEPTKEQLEEAKARKDSTFAFRYYRDHFFDNIDFKDDRIVRTPIYHQKIKEFMQNLTVPIVDSINKAADWLVAKAKDNKELFKYTVWYITTTYETSNLMGADAVFVHMVNKYYRTKQAYWVDDATLKKILERADILAPLLIGKKIGNVTLKDSLGNSRALYSVKAKYTILYFWDPNCGHCQKTTPLLYDLYKKYYSKGVEVYAVNIDRQLKDWEKFINEHELHWINVYDPQYTVSFRQSFDIYSTPVIYLLDEKKEIIAKRMGVEQLEEILEANLKRDEKKLQAPK